MPTFDPCVLQTYVRQSEKRNWYAYSLQTSGAGEVGSRRAEKIEGSGAAKTVTSNTQTAPVTELSNKEQKYINI